MALCSQIERHILFVRFMNQRATVKIRGEQRRESMATVREWEDVHCSIISQFNWVVLTLRSCYSWIDLLHKPPSGGFIWFVAQAMQLRKHCVTLGDSVDGWDIVHSAEWSPCHNGKTDYMETRGVGMIVPSSTTAIKKKTTISEWNNERLWSGRQQLSTSVIKLRSPASAQVLFQSGRHFRGVAEATSTFLKMYVGMTFNEGEGSFKHISFQ